MEKTTLFNLALSHIGGGAYEQGSGVESPCELWYPIVLREAAVRHDWNFARRLITIHPEADGTYHLPVDCMNPLEFKDATSHAIPAEYRIVGRYIHTSLTGAATLLYQSDFTATHQLLPDEAPEYCVAVSYLLAARVARTITGTTEAALQCEELAEVQFTKLLNREAFADASNKTDPLGTTSSLPWQDETYY